MRRRWLMLFLTGLLIVISCQTIQNPDSRTLPTETLTNVKTEGVLRVVTLLNSTDYFIYRGQPMGFQYEALQSLADYMGIRLEVKATNNLTDQFEMLANKEVDLVATALTITRERKQDVAFTVPQMQVRQVLVQRIGDDEALKVNDPIDLKGKPVYVPEGSAFATRLRNLSEEIGEFIPVIEMNKDSEELISMVANGDIDYTVCDENVAQVQASYFSNIDAGIPVSFKQNLAWAMRKDDESLKNVIDGWMETFTSGDQYARMFKKYYNSSLYSSRLNSDYYTLGSGAISPYDDYLKKVADEINWDWRLLASMMYQESRFNPDAKSWAGAFGIMQLMPNTAKRFGVGPNSSVLQQIRASSLFIQWLDERLNDIEDTNERQKFILAAYNVGLGHIIDARNLAREMGKNPDIWDGQVADCLLMKSDPENLDNPVIKYGYCRAQETFRYVADITDRYSHYKNMDVKR